MKSKWINEISGLEEITGYKIYENGTIESYIKRHDKQWIISDIPKAMIQTPNKKGYMKITLRGKCFSVHRLVCMAFLENPLNKKEVNHKDGNKQNNSIENLEWCTFEENLKHKIENNLCYSRSGENHYLYGKKGSSHHSSKTVYKLNDSNEILAVYGSVREAGKSLGVHYSSISKCCCGKLEKAFGYKWTYKL